MDLRTLSSLPVSTAPHKRKYDSSDCEEVDLALNQPRKTKKQDGYEKESCGTASCQFSLNDTNAACDDAAAICRQRAYSPARNVSNSISFHGSQCIPVMRNNFSSRCEKDFGKVKLIGIGGYGKVYRATHKIDGAQYAIKKIKLSKKEMVEALQEVRIIAMLNHPNVVVYKTAWIESCYEDSITKDEESSSSCASVNSSPSSSSRENLVKTSANTHNKTKALNNESKCQVAKASLIKSIFNSVEKYWEKKFSKENNPKEHDIGNSQNEEDCLQKPLMTSARDANCCSSGDGKNSSVLNESFTLELSQESFSKGINRHSTPNLILSNILHIQMQYYEETLKDWLDKRNFCFYIRRDEGRKFKHIAILNGKKYKLKLGFFYGLEDRFVALCLHTFLRLLKGVKYIHSMGIIHHDLKPSNIFVEGLDFTCGCSDDTPGMSEIQKKGSTSNSKNVAHGWQIRIGDFGLACCKSLPKTLFSGNCESLEESKEGDSSLGRGGIHETDVHDCRIVQGKFLSGLLEEGKCRDGIGTKVYAAPEQLKGCCHPKSDIYSLGIILFEMLVPFKTYMERAKVLSELRSNGNVPNEFSKRYPVLTSVVKRSLDIDPERRLSIKVLKKKIQLILKGQKY